MAEKKKKPDTSHRNRKGAETRTGANSIADAPMNLSGMVQGPRRKRPLNVERKAAAGGLHGRSAKVGKALGIARPGGRLACGLPQIQRERKRWKSLAELRGTGGQRRHLPPLDRDAR